MAPASDTSMLLYSLLELTLYPLGSTFYVYIYSVEGYNGNYTG